MVHMRALPLQFQSAATALLGLMLGIFMTVAPLAAEDAPADPITAAPTPDMDALFAELAQPEGDGWLRAQADIERAWSQSGSSALDFLLMRGEAALDAGEPVTAIGHLTALVENAPDFAAGWAARGAAMYFAGQAGPAIDDLAHALRAEPRHWPALTLLGTIYEEMGDRDRARAAFAASLAINPHQEDAMDGLARVSAGPAGQDA